VKPKSKSKVKPKSKSKVKPKTLAKAKAKPKRATAGTLPTIRSSKVKPKAKVDAAHPLVAAIVERHPGAEETDEATLFPAGRHEGHLVVDGSHFVIGDLEVTGAIRIGGAAKLFVTGNVRCANFFAEGDFYCDELHVANTLYGDYEAGSTWANKASGKLWLRGNHDFELEDTDFAEQHDLPALRPSHHREKQPLPAEHQLSPAAVILAVDRPQAYWEGKDPGVRSDEWWALLVKDGASI